MDVRAIVVLAGAENEPNANGAHPETFAGSRLATMDVLGDAPVARVVQRLRRYGISECVVVCGTGDARSIRGGRTAVHTGSPWKTAEAVFNEFVQKDTDVVLIVRMGPYVEMNFEDLIQYHLGHRGHVTVTVDPSGKSLDVVAVSASRRNDAAFLLRHALRNMRSPANQFVFSGYVNWLLKAVDIRQLAIDSFLQRNEIRPVGTEIRPGVWVGDGARIHPRARIVGPAYVGSRARVRAAAVVTRFSTIEHHAEVDCGTVIENSTIAPLMYVGVGLEINCSVVGAGQVIVNLRRNFEVEVSDPKLISTVPANVPLRALSEAASLTAFLPVQLFRGLFSRSRRTGPSGYPLQPQASPSIPVNSAFDQSVEASGSREFASNMVVARRYGNE